ncbi:MAG TPA: hypothetical protein VF329_15365 [Gammaproteobacteria bacterium]
MSGPLAKRLERAAGAVLLAAALAAAAPASAQRGGPGPASARASAPIDLTGYWVSVVSEDWRHRMATPRKGDYESVPLNDEGRRVADAWDLEADNAAGLACKAFGIGGIMRQPGRLHITWEDDATLRIDFDAGMQTRILHFDPNVRPASEKTWQGHSIAEWERPPGGRGDAPQRAQIGNNAGPIAPGGGGLGQRGGPPLPGSLGIGGSLKVVTTGFRAGYLRKNGVPYSEEATITEYFHRLPRHPSGDTWLLVVTIVEDPRYLTEPFYTSTQFKLEPDGAGWNPRPCRTAPPPP